MFTSRLTINADIAGVVMNSSITRQAEGQIAHAPELAAAKAGTLSTRTSDTVGTLTLGAGHGIQTADKVDLYWTGGRRYHVVVGTVAGTSVPITAGAGDALPPVDTAITVQKQQIIDTDFDGDRLEAIAALCAQRGHVGFYDSTTLELSLDLVAGELWHWLNGGAATNPLAGKTITHVVVTQAATAAASLKLGILYDSTV